MSKEYLKLLIMFCICIITTFNLFAQQDNRKFNISLYGGVAPIGLGPASEMENAMVILGYNAEVRFWGTTKYPYSNSGNLSWMIQCQYLLNENFAVSFIAGESDLGSIHGYKSSSVSFLTINNSIATISPMLLFNLSGILQFGAGPAYFRIKANNESHPKIGLNLEASLTYPNDSRLFLKFIYQYRYVGKVNIGAQPQDFSDQYSAPIGEILYDHTFIGTGVGVRI